MQSSHSKSLPLGGCEGARGEDGTESTTTDEAGVSGRVSVGRPASEPLAVHDRARAIRGPDPMQFEIRSERSAIKT